jgi:hypothetical protein
MTYAPLDQYDELPILWDGADVWIIGGGPSLRNFDPRILDGCNVVATNEAFEMFPEADALVFADVGWWQRRHEAVLDKFGVNGGLGLIIGRGPYRQVYRQQGALCIAFKSGLDWSEDRRMLGGNNSGLIAINAAWLMGAKRCYLLGFDNKSLQVGKEMRTNYHAKYPKVNGTRFQARYREQFGPAFARAAKEMERCGLEVVNCTPDSALECFPKRRMEECLQPLR